MVLGYRAAEISGLPVAELLHPEDVPPLLDALARAAAHPEEPIRLCVRAIDTSGTSRSLSLLVTAGTPPGTTRRVTIIARPDPGDGPRDRLETLEREMRGLQRWQTLGSMAMGMASDLHKLAGAAADGLEQAISNPEFPESARATTSGSLAAARQAVSVTRNLLALGREMSEEPQLFTPSDVVDRVMEVVQMLSRPHVVVRSDISAGCPQILGSESQIYRALMNLCFNALEAMEHSAGTLEVRLDTAEPGAALRAENPHLPSGACVRISVRDEGGGIPDEIMPRIFEPFFTTKRRSPGLGLGLMVVRGIVRCHAGAVEVSSQAGRGSRFSIYLPIN
jgi:signal transduction histidine kinase